MPTSPAYNTGMSGAPGRLVCYRCGAAPSASCRKCGRPFCIQHGDFRELSGKGFCRHCIVRRNVAKGLAAITLVLAWALAMFVFLRR